MTNVDDSKAREEALLPDKSFIVQAPAGSGKTELLTQRYLSLLQTVDNPEQIIAITFTKKAASEMRARIIQSLELGALSSPPVEAHRKTTWHLAQKALQHDKEKGWNLLLQPLRLRIKTIDSLCQFLCVQMPITAGPTATLPVSDNIYQHYLSASANCLEKLLTLPDYQSDIKLLLTHLGNDQQKIIELFSNLLSSREQWLPILLEEKENYEQELDKAIALFQQEAVKYCNDSLPIELFPLFMEVLPHFLTDTSDKRLALNELKFKDWQEVADKLLTSQHKFKVRLTKREGFISPSECKNIEEKNNAKLKKELAQNLLDSLALCENFQMSLSHCLKTPRERPDEQRVRLILAIKKIMPLLAAFLELNFKKTQKVDFNSISINAINALGQEDEPSELALFLDYKISHLLIDEFQDTSKQQFRLIERLTSDWDQSSGKTLFLVGDPMQSIYRFRQAEVGFFIQAKEKGIGDLPLTFLQLSRNFRSIEPLIQFSNLTFKSLFPQKDDFVLGAVSYHASTATRQCDITQRPVSLYHLQNNKHQTQKIISLIKENPDQSIAILTRTRNEINQIIPILKQENIPFQGIDIEQLNNQDCIVSLLSLTELFNQPGNVNALIEVLHSPFCGLSFQSIECLRNEIKDLSIYHLFSVDLPKFLNDSEESLNLLRLVTCFRENIEQHVFLPFSQRLYALFSALGGYDLFDPLHHQSIDEFWELLSEHSSPTQIKNIHQFKDVLQKRYAKDQSNSRLTLMTIHKSKGLEFDIVILPSIEKKSIKSDSVLFHHTSIRDEDNTDHLLIAPIKSIYQKEDPLYSFLKYLEELKLDHELKRLLYVAVTRAKQKLYLLTTIEMNAPYPQKSFLNMLSHGTSLMDVIDEQSDAPIDVELRKKSSYTRIESLKVTQTTNSSDSFFEQLPSSVLTNDNVQDKIGTLLHELIYFFGQTNAKKEFYLNRLTQLLSESNLDKTTQNEAYEKGLLTYKNLNSCPIAQWIFSFNSSENEKPLICQDNLYKVDRTFTDKGTRWIIDYKFGQSEADAYLEQLSRYAGAFKSLEPNKRITCMLYYPLTRTVSCWKYQKQALTPVEFSMITN